MNQEDLHRLVLALSNQDRNIEDLLRRIEDLESLESGILVVPLTDYSGDSTIVGWSSRTITQLAYMKIDKLVYVTYNISGTSDNTVTSFTLEYANNALVRSHTALRIQNNGIFATGFSQMNQSSNEVKFYINPDGDGWTASGTKTLLGSFVYHTE